MWSPARALGFYTAAVGYRVEALHLGNADAQTPKLGSLMQTAEARR
jgi:hypothetical protein